VGRCCGAGGWRGWKFHRKKQRRVSETSTQSEDECEKWAAMESEDVTEEKWQWQVQFGTSNIWGAGGGERGEKESEKCGCLLTMRLG